MRIWRRVSLHILLTGAFPVLIEISIIDEFQISGGFFKRNGESLGISLKPGDYKPGDIVTWMLAGYLPHIGIVVEGFALGGSTPLIVHNVGLGPKKEDVLFKYEITGHYRYPRP